MDLLMLVVWYMSGLVGMRLVVLLMFGDFGPLDGFSMLIVIVSGVMGPIWLALATIFLLWKLLFDQRFFVELHKDWQDYQRSMKYWS